MTIAQAVELTGIGLLALALVAAVIYYGLVRRLLPQTPLDLPLLAMTVALLICNWFSVDRQYSAWRILVWCGFLAVFYLALTIPRRWIGWTALALSGAVGLTCMVEFFLTGGRSCLLGNPNITAAWLLSLLMLGVLDLPGSVVSVGLMGLGMAATCCRGAFLSLAGALAVECWPEWWIWAKERRWLSVLVLGVMAVMLVVTVAGRWGTVTKRLATWEEAARLFIERPLVGWGPGVYSVLAEVEPEHPHADNFFLTVAAEMDLVGLAAWGWLFGAAGRLVIRSEAGARLGLVAFAVHQLVDSTFWWYWPGLCVMVCLAVTVGGMSYAHVGETSRDFALA